jgi:type III restriction enzyme
MLDYKDYQQRVLDLLDIYLDTLAHHKTSIEKIEAHNATVEDPLFRAAVYDWTAKTWGALQAKGLIAPRPIDGKDGGYAVPFSPRTDGAGNSVPSICYKIPTGGGKTLLATASLSAIFSRLLHRNTGFVLWVVPNEAIYTQTKKALTNRDHPYRQLLDKAAAGRVKILEKDDRLDARDVDSQLCIMLLMLPSANRETKSTLKVFRDRGSVTGFFPDESDLDGHTALMQKISNLDRYEGGLYPQVKTSLGNALRVIRPIIVMDEQQKAMSALALKTLYSFNPQFMLELSATPKDVKPKDGIAIYANVLASVNGHELERESMVKLPLNVKVKAGDDWQDTLRESSERLNGLNLAATRHLANGGGYIRPILLVQVERVGLDQRNGIVIHADDAKDFLLSLGYAPDEIAIKTSVQNDLKSPENQDLLHPTCRVRVIITKAALQEGWDCPFAYVLCSLAASRNLSAMTQLVGRILRQPYAIKTGVSQLDECYVYCQHAASRDVVASIKQGLELDGMADLAAQVVDMVGGDDGSAPSAAKRKIPRRPKFAKTQIYLPQVIWTGVGSQAAPRLLDYEADILMSIDWSQVDVADFVQKTSFARGTTTAQEVKVSVGQQAGRGVIESTRAGQVAEGLQFDSVYAVRALSDLVPNPWVAHELVERLKSLLLSQGHSLAGLGELASQIIEQFRGRLIRVRDTLTEAKFMADVERGAIQFKLRTDSLNWPMPQTIETDRPLKAHALIRDDGLPIGASIFESVYEDDFNGQEGEFACYLDSQAALQWWHRNVAKAGQYFVQGWRKAKVYPDFVFALRQQDGKECLYVWETKGDQLAGSLDSQYKEKLLKKMSTIFAADTTARAGELQIENENGQRFECDLVVMSEWKNKINQHLQA